MSRTTSATMYSLTKNLIAIPQARVCLERRQKRARSSKQTIEIRGRAFAPWKGWRKLRAEKGKRKNFFSHSWLPPLFLPSFLSESARCIFPSVITCTFYYPRIRSPRCTPTPYYTVHASLTFPSPFLRSASSASPPISIGLKPKLLEIGSVRRLCLRSPQGNTRAPLN